MSTCDDGLRVGRKFKFIPGTDGARSYPSTYRISRIIEHATDRLKDSIYFEPLKGPSWNNIHNWRGSYTGEFHGKEWAVQFVGDHKEFTDEEYERLLV